MPAQPTQTYLLTTLAILLAGFAHGDEKVSQFESEVLPILKAKCSACHGADDPEGGFRVVNLAAIMAGSESGSVVAAGKPDVSRIFELISSGEMPPKGEESLSLEQIHLIREWISDGRDIREFESRQQVTTDRIVPLLLLRCAACHGHRRREANLDLRTKAAMLKGGKSGAVIVSGNPAESLLIRRIHAGEMPPRRQLVSVSVKPMESDELALLERWIAAGMPDAQPEDPPTQLRVDTLVSDEARQFWSFQPPQARLPQSKQDAYATSEIDAFVAARQREHRLTPAPEADRITLIRRLSLDLLGLPPTPEEIDEFIADPHPLAYQRLVERLLASPHYGARWARHWLDAAGYADSEGAQNEDRVRPNMWRYRDYVIRAFNDDKPYDRFLHEQIAGDELADYENAEVITDQLYDNLVATGFLRTAPDRTFANITNFVPDRLEVIADEIQILASAVLGLTIHCARCHSHKFDPISQHDYYQLAALLKDALDEHDWLGPQARTLTRVTTAERQQWERHKQTIDDRAAELKQQIKAAATEDAKKPLEAQLKQHESLRRPEPRIRALWSRGEPSPTYLLKRGNYLTPGSQVLPSVPAVLISASESFVIESPRPGATATGRRLALAKWLTQSTNPLTARVMVNRIWQHHFGRGIVSTPGNFGLAGDAPTHPELLDWLAVQFMRQGWSVKALHRTIVTSRTYRRSSQATAEQLAADPDNRWLTRMPLRRMEAEVLRDSLLFVAGQLDEAPFGPPDDIDVQPDGLVTSRQTARGWRRSVYVLHRRTKLPTLLENFDSPQMGPNCLRRGESIVAPQALHLLNNPAVHGWARKFAERACREAAGDAPDRIKHIHRIAFGREPGDEQLAAAVDTLHRLEQQWLLAIPASAERTDEAARRALANYCHAVMNSAAFSYVD